jgi:monoamine oxidase
MSNAKVIIVGGGLSGLSAAHTVLERGGNVVSIYTANTRPGRD